MSRSLRLTSYIVTAACLLVFVGGCGAPGAGSAQGFSLSPPASVPPLPTKPVTLNIIDVAGDMEISKPMMDAFVKANPQLVSQVRYTQGTAPELPAKIKAQQDARHLDIDLVLTGNDALAAGIQQQLWEPIFPNYSSEFPNLSTRYLPGANTMANLAQGQAIVDDYGDFGPLLEYLPGTVSSPPTSAQALLDWAKANPGKFTYARPANSGPGRAFIQALPYILGDKNPQDPVNGWDKTWAYLKQLGQYVQYYPSSTSESMRDLANGTVNMVATTTGWDINPRALGTVPQNAAVTTLAGTNWIIDSSYVAIPRGVSNDVLAVDLKLMAWMLQPQQQAMAYDHGYMYPGPAVNGVIPNMAPQDSQQMLQRFARPGRYNQIIAKYPQVAPLSNQQLVTMFDMWDREIGNGKGQP
jgi:putative spermidine/putrescine transport system substrate-binding protein